MKVIKMRSAPKAEIKVSDFTAEKLGRIYLTLDEAVALMAAENPPSQPKQSEEWEPLFHGHRRRI